MNYFDLIKKRQQDERAKRMAQLSIGVTDGASPQNVMPMQVERQLPRFMGGKEVGVKNVSSIPQPMQGNQQFGPPMPAAYQVAGYTKGLQDAGPDAQAYADKFAGGDLSKVKARLINIDGEMKNDYYTRGLLDAPMPDGQVAPDASSGGYGPPQPDTLDRFRMWLGGLLGGGA